MSGDFEPCAFFFALSSTLPYLCILREGGQQNNSVIDYIQYHSMKATSYYMMSVPFYLLTSIASTRRIHSKRVFPLQRSARRTATRLREVRRDRLLVQPQQSLREQHDLGLCHHKHIQQPLVSNANEHGMPFVLGVVEEPEAIGEHGRERVTGSLEFGRNGDLLASARRGTRNWWWAWGG